MNATSRLFVGRDAELRVLEDAIARTFEGRGALVLISGEPGIGKTRLADEVAAIAGGQGADVLWGRAWESGGAPAYWPWVQALRSLLRSTDPDDLLRGLGAGAAELAQLLPEIRERFPKFATRTASEDDGARFRLFDAVLQLLRSASASRPLVLILDDLHASDASSILLLRFLGAGLTGMRVLVVAAYRDSDLPRNHPMRTAVADLARLQSTIRLRPRGLAAPQVAGIIHAVSGVEAEPSLVAAIQDASEGNPLFVGEIIHLLVAEGRLDPHRASDEAAALTIPESVREAIERRLERLGDATLELLEPASVLGRDFALWPLALLAGLVEGDVLDRLEPAREAGILVELREGSGGFRFAHALTRDTIYQGLPVARRRRMHLEAGAALERIHAADPEPHLAEIAHQFLAGADPEPGRAIEYARRAAERATHQLAFEEGVRLLAAALDALERSPDEAVRCDILLALGDAQARAGDPRARNTFQEAAEIANRRGLADRLARAALGFGGRFVWEASRDDRRLVQLIGDALAALPDADDPLRIRLMARLAAGPMRDQTDWRPRDELSLRAVDAAGRLGDPATLAYALDGRYSAVWRPDNVAERISIATDLIAAAEASGDRERTLQGHHYRCLARLEIADIDGCRADADAQRRIAAELKQPSQLFYTRTTDATLAALAGRYAEAETLIRDAHAEGARAEQAMAIIYRVVGLHAIRRLRGGLGEIADEVATLVERFPTYIVLRCVHLDTLVRLGLADEARYELAALAGNRFAALPRNDEWVYGMALLAEAAVALGERAACETLDELLVEMAGRVAVSAPDACLGALDRARGLLALALGLPDSARDRFQAAVNIDDRLGARGLGAESRLAFARLLLRSDSSPDTERARRLISEALAVAGELGLEPVDRAARELLVTADLGGPSPAQITRTFLFTDIVASTELIGAIGDAAWVDLRAWHDRALRAEFAVHGGQEIDHAGDGFFVAFLDPRSAIAAAAAIQRSLEAHRREHGFAPAVRIGIHAAEAAETATGFVGHGVHQAARISALAGGGEIVASRSTAEAGGMLDDVKTGAPRAVTLKGIAEPVEVATLDWRAGTPRA